MAIAWMRRLEIIFTSKKFKKQLKFGTNNLLNKNDLNIDVVCNKYMSALKDSCTIRISNLTYSEILQLIQGEYYDVKVNCGYRNGNLNTIFDGGVLYISNSLDDTKTHTAIILCASKLVARFGQSRINLTLNSGINLYSAIKFVCRRAGIPESNVSEQLKTTILQDIMNVNDSPGGWLEKLTNFDQSLIVNSDSSFTSSPIFSIYSTNKSGQKYYVLTNNQINLSGGYPQATKDGITLTILPTIGLVCGDIIKLDNSLIDVSTSSASELSDYYGFRLDANENYVIYEMNYHLQNRGSEFSVSMLCKQRDLLLKMRGK